MRILLIIALIATASAFSILGEGIVPENNDASCINAISVGTPTCAAAVDDATIMVSFIRLNISHQPRPVYPNTSVYIISSHSGDAIICSEAPNIAVAATWSTAASASLEFRVSSPTHQLYSAIITNGDPDACSACPSFIRYSLSVSSPTSQMPFDPCASAWERAQIEASRELAAVLGTDIEISGIGTPGIVCLYITTVISAITVCTAHILQSVIPKHVSNRLKLIAIIFTMAYMFLLSGQGFQYFFLYNNAYIPDAQPDSDMLTVSYAIPIARYIGACFFVPATFDLVRLLLKGNTKKSPSLRSIAPFLISEIQITLASLVTSPVKWPMWFIHICMLSFAIFDIRNDTTHIPTRGFMWLFILLLVARTVCWPLAEGARIFASTISVPIECFFDSFWILAVAAMCIVYRNHITRTALSPHTPSADADGKSDSDESGSPVHDSPREAPF